MATFVQPSCASLTRRCVRLLLQFSIAVASVCWFCALVCGAQPAHQPRRVVVVVWDAMRPDFVSEHNTPAQNPAAFRPKRRQLPGAGDRSEEHTSELQAQSNIA